MQDTREQKKRVRKCQRIAVFASRRWSPPSASLSWPALLLDKDVTYGAERWPEALSLVSIVALVKRHGDWKAVTGSRNAGEDGHVTMEITKV